MGTTAPWPSAHGPQCALSPPEPPAPPGLGHGQAPPLISPQSPLRETWEQGLELQPEVSGWAAGAGYGGPTGKNFLPRSEAGPSAGVDRTRKKAFCGDFQPTNAIFFGDLKTSKLYPYYPFVSFIIGYFLLPLKSGCLENVNRLENSISLRRLAPFPSPFPTAVLVASAPRFHQSHRNPPAPPGSSAPANTHFPQVLLLHWTSSRFFAISVSPDLTHW